MKISEILINGLMSTRLFEMAFEKKVAIDKARNLQNQIARHLVKIAMYSNSEYINHWTTEVNAWLDDIQDNKIKGTNRPLTKKDLLKILLNEPLGTIDDVQSKINRIYKEQPNLTIDQPRADEVSRSVSWILSNACKDIAENQFTDIRKY